MWNEDDRKWLYDKMQKAGVETGTYDEFTSSMDNDEDRDWYYQKAKGMNLDLGSADDFRAMMATPKESKPAAAQAVNTTAHDTAQSVMTQQPMQASMPQATNEPQQVQEPQQMMNTSQLDPKYQLNEDGSVNPWNMLETERTLDDQGNTVNKPKLVKGADGTDVYRNAMTGEEYNPLSPEGMEMAGQNTSIVPTDLKKANREQVANLSADIDNAFAEYQKKRPTAISYGTYYGGAAGVTNTQDKEFQTLTAAKQSVYDAQKMIEAADANAKNGTIGEWLNSSFAGGATRGFGDKFFDVRTWDMGLSDAVNNKTLYEALQKADSGQELTKSEQMLLDAKSVEMATNAYFGSYLGRGYQAGAVTAESLPFMLEMAINPASTAGNTAQSMLARYAMKRLGKKASLEALEKGAEGAFRQAFKEVGAKETAKILGGRLAGDLAGSAAMAATTGTGRVTADAFDRMNNGEEDWGTAIAKAYGGTVIENYSEMVGEYFAPVLGVAGKGLSKGMDKIGLGAVNDFIENVSSSRLAQLVSDFENSAKWSGLFSEYAEEVTGNIMNALTVGDMTLDTAEGTGVFNLDQNIDTFLGTALMGGALSGIKTLGYRTPKYSAHKAMTGADDKAAALFADPAEWGNIRNTIAFGTDEDAKEMLSDVLGSDAFSAEQKAAVMNYASKAEAYKGVMMAEQKRRGENNGSAEVDVETSYDNGQSLETPQEKNDARNMYDMQRERLAGIVDEDFLQQFDEDPLEALNDVMTRDDFTAEERQAALDYVNAKATYDGMIDKVRDDIDSQVAASDASIDSRTNRAGANAGMIVPATMKMNDRQVYVIDGDIQMMDDGSMVDVSKSSESILVRDAETGKLEFVSPHDVLNLGQSVSAEQEKATQREAITQQVAQEQSAIIEGVLPFNAGDVYELADENGQTVQVTVVQDNGDGNVTVTMNGQNVPMAKDQVQAMSDAANMKRLADYQQQKNGGADNAPAADATGTVAGSQQRSYAQYDELMLRDADGNGVRGSIVDGPNADGLFEIHTPVPILGKPKVGQWTPEEIDAAIMEHNGEAVSQPAADAAGTVAGVQNTGENVINGGETVQPTAENVQAEPMPMIGEVDDAEPNFLATTPERGLSFLFGESGWEERDADYFIDSNAKASAKEVEKIEGKRPKPSNFAKFNKDMAAWNASKQEAEAKAEYWKQMKALRDAELAKQKAERDAAEKARQEAATDQAIAEEAAYAAEQERLAAEQEERGANNVAPAIREKWNNAKKVKGLRDQITLPNGKVITGTHYMVEAMAITPSHDANNGFTPTVGFPVNETGENVNTRDYYRDKDAQTFTNNVSADFDERGMGVVVSKDAGIPYSGNGRTMAGQLAATNGTDGKYIGYLAKYGQKYGYTAEQVGEFEHPRDVFVPDEQLPYTSEVFDMFNQQEMKGQSKTEQAVKLGKVVDDATFGRIITSINRFERMSDFYADAKAATEAIGELQKAGAISQAQVAEMYDGDGISAIGRELLENMLVGKAFENNPDAVREITAFRSVRQTVIKALGEILNNVKLGEDYSLEEELAGAIDLVYKARKEGGYKEGERVSGFARQMNLGFLGEDMTVADMNNVTMLEIADILNSGFETRLKVYMQNYNTHAQESAAGQLDLFSGEVMSKEDILNDVNNLFNNGTEQETADTRAEGVAEDGAVNNGGTESAEASAVTTGNAAEAIADAEAETDTNPSEAQKEAGNYKKGHVKVDGYDITIENPKGSVRSGKDADGKEWSVTMNNTYGYIRGTEGVDGDHIDVFLSDNPEQGNVYVVDQVDADGNFDEHKVMYGFGSAEEARDNYLANYSEGWKMGTITEVSKEEFKKWIESSHRKTKPFSEYKSVKKEGAQGEEALDPRYTPGWDGDYAKWKKRQDYYDEIERKEKAAADEGRVAYYFSDTDSYGQRNGTFHKVWLKPENIQRDEYNNPRYKGLFLWTQQEAWHSEEGFQQGHIFYDEQELAMKGWVKDDNEKKPGKAADEPQPRYLVTPTTYTTAKGKELQMQKLVINGLDKKQITAANKLAKERKGWWSREDGGFLMRSEEDAKWLADAVLGNEEAVEDAQPASLADVQKAAEVVEEKPSEKPAVKEYHGGEQVWSKRHNENKHILMAHHVTMADGATFVQSYTFTDGTAATALEVEDPHTEQKQEQKTEAKASEPKRIVSDERMEELKEKLRKKLRGQLNVGVPPEVLAMGVELAVGKIERGLTKFADYAKSMVEDLGDLAKPYLKAFYNAVRDMPEAEEYADQMDSYEYVRKFDVANMGNADVNAMATAEMVMNEQKVQEDTDKILKQTTETRNNERHETEKQIAASTEAVASEAETVASEAESVAESGDEAAINEQVSKIDEELEKVNAQLALLGYYEADTSDPSKFHESYGYMKTAEKKAVADADKLAKAIAASLGVELGRKKVAQANIAPAGGDIYFKIPLTESRELYVNIGLIPETNADTGYSDDLRYNAMMYRIEDPTQGGMSRYVSGNEWFYQSATLDDVTSGIKSLVKHYVREFEIKPLETKATTEKTVKKVNEKGTAKKKAVPLQAVTLMGDLFADLMDGEVVSTTTTINNNNNEQQLERDREGVRTEGLPANGNQQAEQTGRVRQETGQTSERADRGGEAGRTKGLGSELQSTRGLDGQLKKKAELTPLKPEERKNTNNNHAERGKDYAPKSVEARIDANIKAIEVMQELMENGQKATPEQMAVLRQYSGWGGLGKAFTDAAMSKRLRELLGDEAYEQANMSRNSAYYTPAAVIDAMWDVAKAMGFQGGNVLEGSAGIGNIIGAMPMDMSDRSNIHAVEIDGTTGNILSLLYPDAKVEVQGFEATRVPNGSVDLAITNVPFVTGLHVMDTTGDKDLSKKFRDIHDFCIAKNIRKLRDGGIGIFISSSGTMDNSKKLRDWIVSDGNADVVGAFRLNNETFGGTGATSDIIVVRKRVNGVKSANAIDVSTTTAERSTEYDTGETKKVKGQLQPVVKQLAMDYNRYFVEHPENMGGKMMFGFENNDTFRPTSRALYPEKGKNQGELLNKWVKSFDDMAEETSATEQATVATDAVYEELGAGVKEGSMLLDKDGRICVAQFGKAVPLNLNDNKIKGKTKKQCFEAYSAIKDALADVLKYQTENDSDAGLKPLLAKLNKAFDDFVKNFGHLHKNNQIAWLKNDVDWSSIMALETTKDKVDSYGKVTQEYGKTDIFKQRVVEKDKAPEPKNVKDGIIASIYQYGRVNVPYIADKLGKTEAEVRDEIIESGLGFENPVNMQLEVSYEYLSGNVREKLQQAMDANEGGKYDANVKALEKVVPMDIPAHLIDFTLGSSWVDHKLYEDYVKDRTDIDVTLTNAGGTWIMKTPYFVNQEKNRSAGVYSEMLRKTVFGHQLIEAAIQNKSITVSETHKKWDGTTETTTDKEATQACATRIDEIRQDFKDWARQKMQTDSEMSAKMERVYNDQFNNFVPVSVPEEFVPEYFGGASHKFKMRPHQAKAIVRGTMQPVLLAHEVGTGKTFTLISTAMEMRRLGTARKPMVVVQNATVGQFVASAKALYPNAKVLTLEEKDHTGEGRKNFYAKIKYNDWDMIVVPQSVFERIPDSEERQMAFIEDKIQEKLMALEAMREADPDSWVTKAAEREIEQLEAERAQVGSVAADKRKSKDEKKEAVTRQNAEVKAREMLDRATDDVENFDDMGIDAILVDEAHEYKHLGFATAMQRGVKGVDPSYSKKAQGVYLKAQAVLEKNNGRNVIFATGTPISNTAAEIWTFMRYLMPAYTMKDYGIYYFDDFVRNFGNLQTMLEFTTSGKFKENNRFAGYVNLPELVRIWSSVSDTVLTREAGGVSDKIPDMETGKAQDIYLPQTRSLRSVMKFVKSELNRYENMTGKEKKENSAIPLKMYGIAKAAAVDARLVLEDAADDPNSKTNEAVRRTVAALKKTAKYKGTVALFADNYQNKHSGFNIYEDIREKLIKEGVPADQIVVMKSGMSVKKKLEIFDKVNRGDVRVIMGSTFTLGTGVNIQERLHTLIHLDAPNRPMDYTQRNGRILRQGNLHKDMGLPVSVLRFGVEDSLDVTAYQRLKTKGAIADSIMNGKQMMSNSMENRALEEEEDVFGDTVAQLSGSEYAMLKNQAEKDVRKYEAKRKQWEADQTYIHNAIPRLEEQIVTAQQQAANNRRYAKLIDEGFKGEKNPAITIGKQTFADLEAMGEYFKEYNKKLKDDETAMRESHMAEQRTRKAEVKVGNFTFDVKTTLKAEVKLEGVMLVTTVRRKTTYSCDELGMDDVAASGGYLKNAIEEILEMAQVGGARRLSAAERNDETVKRLKGELEQVKSREGKPFEYEKELEAAHEHYDEYSELMKKEMEEKEKKYAEMDSEVETATNVDSADEAEEDNADDNVRMRERTEFTDGEILPISPERYGLEFSLSDSTMPSYSSKEELLHAFQEKHPAYAAVLTADGNGIEVTAWKNVLDKNIRKPRRRNGEPTKAEKQRAAYVERKTRIAIDMVNAKAEKLGLNAEVKTDTEGLTGRRARAKGWYDTTNGKITIILPNHSNGQDVMRTLMHEGVAHHGLRQMFGEDFDTFLDNVYANASEEVRKRIAEMAARKGWDFHTATEEYLAALSEDIDFERKVDQTWWQKVKFFFIDMLRKAGIVLDDKLTDNDLRYIVWKSYERMAYAGEYGAIRDARTEVMKQSLGVGNYAQTDTSGNTLGTVAKQVADGSELLFRGMDQRDHATIRDSYEREIKTATYQMREAVQDSMLSLRRMMEEIEKATGNKIADYENAYMAENALSSKNLDEQRMYKKMLFEPMLDEVYRLAKEEDANGDKPGRDGVTRYMMAKHGLERQKLMEARAEQAGEKSDRDFAGLTGLFETDDLADAIQQAEQLVADFESAHKVDDLWKKVNACTKSTLEKSYKCGIISKEGFERISKMYDFYIPLRGFKEDTSDKIYAYLNHETGSFQSPVRGAFGRETVASDIFANILNMADSAIAQGNKNLVKQKFLKMVMNHPTDLASVNKMWLKKNDITGEWEAVTAQLDPNDSAEQVFQKTEAFEENMAQLAESDPDHYKRGKDLKDIPYRVLGNNLSEHQVYVKMGGQDYIITINGNPRVAQAVNGLSNPDSNSKILGGKLVDKVRSWTRWMAQNFTTRNPEFVLSNFLRDATYANTTIRAKEPKNYAVRYNQNFTKVGKWGLDFGKRGFGFMLPLLMKYEKGTLDMNNEMEKAFKEFMQNGGETGYTHIRSVEENEKDVEKYLKMKDGKAPLTTAYKWLTEHLDYINRSVENRARFAAFLTSRQMGRTVERSVMDAKEVSVNFNKKGAGSQYMDKAGQTRLGNAVAGLTDIATATHVFFNAGVQGDKNFAGVLKHAGAKAVKYVAYLFLAGLANAAWGGGDDDKYKNLTPYERRNNICFKVPGTDMFVKIPFGVEFRTIYGLGELAGSMIRGYERMSPEEIMSEIAGLLSQVSPIDMMEGGKPKGKNLLPSLVRPEAELYDNEDFMGRRIHNKTDWNEHLPEWKRAGKHTNASLIKLSRKLNEWTQFTDEQYIADKGLININPSVVEHLVEGHFGGLATFFNKGAKVVEYLFSDEGDDMPKELELRNIPMASRVLTTADENAEARRVNNEFYKYYNEYLNTKKLVNMYNTQQDEGVIGAAEKYDFLYNSPEYGRYEIVDDKYDEIRDKQNELKEEVDPQRRQELEEEITDLKREMIEAVRAYDDARNNR